VIIDNYPEDRVEWLDAENNPEDLSMGSRKIPFSRTVYIEQEDFREDPPKKFFRLAPGREIRLKHAYYIKCEKVVKDKKTGEIIELHCTYDPKSRGGWTNDGRKVRGTSHWVSAAHALPAEVRLYTHLFIKTDTGEVEDGKDFKDYINPESLEILRDCLVEPSLKDVEVGTKYQFLRQGYFCVDADSSKDKLVFNRTVTLRDTWARIQRSMT
jgi:glutaminyl-tRNA synthetase